MHPVDKVHVEMAWRAEHGGRPGRGPEARVGGQIVWSAVGLDLDDPRQPKPGHIVAEQQPAEQGVRGIEWCAGQGSAREWSCGEGSRERAVDQLPARG